ncbi:MAG TPA: hypothetical protein VL996_00340 [Methylocella sp.]|nr:hypothetical protein [Methylocella sp.]
MKLEEREYGVLAFVDDNGRVWAQCAKASPDSPDYVIEGPLSGFLCDEGTFTRESERAFQDWLGDHLLDEELFFVKDKETALDFARRIAEAACQILKD